MSEGEDPYVYPGTTVLEYKLGIRRLDELERAERFLSTKNLARTPLDYPMSSEGFRAIHREAFHEIQDWAGQYRSVNLEMVVCASRSVTFTLAPFVDVDMRRVFGELQADSRLRSLDRKTFACRAAHDF